MEIKKICQTCGKEFTVPHWRPNAKYCSPDCRQEGLKAKPNVVCTNCGKYFHMRLSQQKRFRRSMGFFCCTDCKTQYRKVWFIGENNHQFGLKGDKNSSYKGETCFRKNHKLTEVEVYSPGHPKANQHGRVVLHHRIVEIHYDLFDEKYFDVINGEHILKKGFIVHHKDGDHNNNAIENLEIMTRAEHSSHHNKLNPMQRDINTGRFTKREVI